MGSEPVEKVVLLRHAYILPRYQRQGISSELIAHIEGRLEVPVRVIVGTYAANYKARSLLEKTGYRLSEDSAADLHRYYDIPEDRVRGSVTYVKNLAPEAAMEDSEG